MAWGAYTALGPQTVRPLSWIKGEKLTLNGVFAVSVPAICHTEITDKWQLHESLKFGQLTLRKIIKIVANLPPVCQILRLKCTKFNFGWGSVQTPLGELTALPRPFWPTSKGKGGEGREGKGREGTERGWGGGEGMGSLGKVPHPFKFTPP